MTGNGDSEALLTEEQFELVRTALRSNYEADADEECDEARVEVNDGAATVRVDCSQSSGVVSVTNDSLSTDAFYALQSEVKKVASAADVGDVELHDSMSQYVSFRVDYS